MVILQPETVSSLVSVADAAGEEARVSLCLALLWWRGPARLADERVAVSIPDVAWPESVARLLVVAPSTRELLRIQGLGSPLVEGSKCVLVDSLDCVLAAFTRCAWFALAALDVLPVPVWPVCWPEVAAALRCIAVPARASGLAGGESVR